MEVHGLAALREARLRLSTESGRHVLYAQEPTSGRLLKLSAPLADALLKLRRRFTGGRDDLSEDELKTLVFLGSFLDKTRRDALDGQKRFNPLFMNFPLFSPAPFQHRLTGLADLLISPIGAATLIIGFIFALWISAFSNFALISRLGDVFSLEALVTFAIMAPFLKIAHEFGHILTATRYRVPVRNAGILFVALYPLPFVDCTDADFLAGRRQRIVISLGGLLADLTVALIAFTLWHFVENEAFRQICANIFMFNTVTTLLFNLNPLMKLDGYFALSDALHRRNYYQESTEANKRIRKLFAAFDFRAAWAFLRRNALRIGYSILSALYKIYILAFIFWTLIPQYLGLGLMVVVWGAVVMFASPFFVAKPTGGEEAQKGRFGKWIWRGGFLALLAALAFVPLKHRTTVDVALDVENAYLFRSAADGVVSALRAPGAVSAGAALGALSNADADAEIALAREDVALYELVFEASRQSDPLGNTAARQQLQTSEQALSRLEREAGGRTLVAAEDGVFWNLRDISVGAAVAKGDPVGVFLPIAEESRLIGTFPEVYASKLAKGAEAIVLRLSDETGRMIEEGVGVSLIRSAVNPETGVQGFQVAVTAPLPPTEAISTSGQLQITFAAEPIWRHVVFHYHRLRLEFLSNQDRAQQ